MTFRNLFSLLPLAGVLMFVGCGKLPDEKTNKAANADSHSDADHPDEHAHPTEGPHHGMLVELGKEEYHAEVLFPEHNETSAVTVYILDSSAKKTVPIDAESITLNMSHDGKPEQFQLPAKPEAGDPEGEIVAVQLQRGGFAPPLRRGEGQRPTRGQDRRQIL